MADKTIYDITVGIHPGMATYPGDPEVKVWPLKSQAAGKTSNVSAVQLGSHTGTHLDAPAHFFSDKATADQVPLNLLMGPARVFEFEVAESIGQRHLEHLPLAGVERVLLKTRNSRYWDEDGFRPDFVYLTADGARFLVDAGVRLVGIDYLSIEKFGDKAAPVHRLLLDRGVALIEGLNLAGVPTGDYELICLPLKLLGVDGAPVRAVLRVLCQPE